MKRVIFLVLGIFLLAGCITAPGGTAGTTGGTGGAGVQQNQTINVNVGETAGTQTGGGTQGGTVPATGAAGGETVTPPAETNPLDAISHKEITFTTQDGWKIYGTLYYSGSDQYSRPTKAIVLIPELGKERSSYDELVPLLHNAISGADIIALDMRGHGKSTNLGTYQAFQTGDFRASKNDLKALRDYLGVSRPSITTYYIVGTSMGSSIAMDYAASHDEVAKLVMISPGTAYRDFDINEYAQAYLHELYITAASEDSYSMASANTINAESPSDTKVLKIYYSISDHGTELFDATKDKEQPLLPLVADWLK
ncbi:alpha/beta fold hydrolase [Candidatus Micrarchaeota archaeon]|nr:alpha/beta fold hydrolase [Candidatus Micrarchaeota archaeon]